jgi:hypothetical protein
MELVPIGLKEANAFVGVLHRHHGESRGHKFSIGAEKNGELVGVAIIGRPVARPLDNGFNAEVTRLCTNGTRNACSFLYGAAARAAKEMGYRKIYTYTLASEPGDSLRAAGWTCEGRTAGGSWNCNARQRDDKHPTEPKWRWSRQLRPERTPSSSNDALRWLALALAA